MVIPYDPFYQPFVVRSLRFAEELSKRGHEVQYFYDTMRPSKRGNRVRDALPAGFRSQPCSWHAPSEYLALARAIEGCDVVHFQKAKPPHSWLALVLARAFDKPIHQDWDDDEGAFWRQAARDRASAIHDPSSLASAAKAALIAAASGSTEWVIPKLVDSVGAATIALRAKSERWGAEKGAIFPARVGVDCDVFTPEKRDEALRKQLGLDGPTVLYAGSFDVRPDLDFFIEALRALLAEMASARALVLGGGFGRQRFVDELVRAGVRDRVVLSEGLIPFSEMPRYVASSDLAALPFRDNAINRGKSSLTLLECMASGLPVVTHDVGDIGWMLGGGGELAQLDDPRDFGSRMARLLAKPEQRAKLGAAGRARAESNFTWRGTVDYLEMAYRYAIANHGAHGSALLAGGHG
ncbi:MAG TPA: glycosyltransferase, partial [Polyangiales bacterium]